MARQQPAPTFFATPAELRAWLHEHHAEATELMVGYYKKGSGRSSITWPESVDEALCFGWIDGVRRSIDAESYMIRFTPRQPRSTWSAVNIKRVEELTARGLMHPAGLSAYAARVEARSGTYAYEQGDAIQLGEAHEQEFRASPAAWEFFQNQAPSYRKAAVWWVVSAKRDETRRKRLATLIADSGEGRRVGALTPPKARASST